MEGKKHGEKKFQRQKPESIRDKEHPRTEKLRPEATNRLSRNTVHQTKKEEATD